jgi:hypothetical protein
MLTTTTRHSSGQPDPGSVITIRGRRSVTATHMVRDGPGSSSTLVLSVTATHMVRDGPGSSSTLFRLFEDALVSYEYNEGGARQWYP